MLVLKPNIPDIHFCQFVHCRPISLPTNNVSPWLVSIHPPSNARACWNTRFLYSGSSVVAVVRPVLVHLATQPQASLHYNHNWHFSHGR
ncbi:hypothetical protein CH063_02240 [Colletotrichum higginsianum]|uniref:Uncharacterized protein n=1 Tax=Colletotrichum higginsianum (strain IMI 349063) TaxID=759273 RepID=H1VI99_COLHI|nr:hypothetical protein CH063_02240 [Colletotrichum higginsianum]